MITQSTPYAGTRRKLVLAFDVGTTYSGISYRCEAMYVVLMVHANWLEVLSIASSIPAKFQKSKV